MTTTPGSLGAAPGGDLRAYVSILRRHKWTVLFVIALVMGAALLVSVRETPMYGATSRVYVKPMFASQTLTGVSLNFFVSMPTEQQLISSTDVAELAAKNAREMGAAEGDTGEVGSSNPANTTFLDITYRSSSPAEAQVWANAYAKAYAQFRQDQAMSLYDEVRSGLQSRLDDLQKNLRKSLSKVAKATGARALQLQSEADSIRSRVSVAEGSLGQLMLPSPDATQVVAEAGLPTRPYSPNYLVNLGLAFILGVVLAVTVAFVRERFDDRMAWRDDLEELIGAPVLAVVPRVPSWRKRRETRLSTRDEPKGATAEAYRAVRTTLEFVARSGDKKIFTVASPSMGEGKTTTTANLAVSMAQAGKRVIAVSLDLRKPRLHKFFDRPNSPGVTDVLKDGVGLPAVTQHTGVENLRLIASGATPHDPAEIQGGQGMADFLQDLRRFADYVVIDTAPVLQVADALVIAPQTDGVILVVDASSTTKAAVRLAREQLEQVGATIIGGIFNDFDPGDAKSYPGYYKYYYYGYGGYGQRAGSYYKGAGSEGDGSAGDGDGRGRTVDLSAPEPGVDPVEEMWVETET